MKKNLLFIKSVIYYFFNYKSEYKKHFQRFIYDVGIDGFDNAMIKRFSITNDEIDLLILKANKKYKKSKSTEKIVNYCFSKCYYNK